MKNDKDTYILILEQLIFFMKKHIDEPIELHIDAFQSAIEELKKYRDKND